MYYVNIELLREAIAQSSIKSSHKEKVSSQVICAIWYACVGLLSFYKNKKNFYNSTHVYTCPHEDLCTICPAWADALRVNAIFSYIEPLVHGWLFTRKQTFTHTLIYFSRSVHNHWITENSIHSFFVRPAILVHRKAIKRRQTTSRYFSRKLWKQTIIFKYLREKTNYIITSQQNIHRTESLKEKISILFSLNYQTKNCRTELDSRVHGQSECRPY